MPTVVGNMVKETTTTTGTGTIDLDGAPTGFQGFADEFTSGAQVPYTLVDDPDNPNAWEVGLGTFTAGTPNTLSRDTVYDSSASGSQITLSGTTTVISTPLAAQTTVKDGDNTLTGANTFNGPLVAGPGTELTISSGSITPTGNYHTVDTEADAGNDNLDSVVVTNVPDGGYLLLRGEAPSLSPPRFVTVRHGISPGNITLQAGANYVLDASEKAIMLQRRGSLFVELWRAGDPQLVGTVDHTIRSTAPSGWLLLNGDSVGDTGSGATQTGPQYEALFKLFWDSMTDTHAAVSSGRGASAQADWDAGKTLTMPDARGRALIGTGTGAGLTARTHGDDSIGSEDAIVVTHSHTAGTLAADSGGDHTHDVSVESASSGAGGFVQESDGSGSTNTATAKALSGGAHGHTVSGSTANAGSSGTGANMMPALALNTIVKY